VRLRGVENAVPNEPLIVRLKIAPLVLLCLSVGCLMRQYTPEEQAYWNLHNESAFHEIHREVFEVKHRNVPSPRTSERMESFIKDVLFPYCEEMRL